MKEPSRTTKRKFRCNQLTSKFQSTLHRCSNQLNFSRGRANHFITASGVTDFLSAFSTPKLNAETGFSLFHSFTFSGKRKYYCHDLDVWPVTLTYKRDLTQSEPSSSCHSLMAIYLPDETCRRGSEVRSRCLLGLQSSGESATSL